MSSTITLSTYLARINTQFSIEKFTRYDARLFLDEIRNLMNHNSNNSSINVIQLATSLKKYVYPYLSDEIIKNKTLIIVRKIFDLEDSNSSRKYIHQFAYEGNITGVKALVRLCPSSVYLKSNSSQQTPLNYSERKIKKLEKAKKEIPKDLTQTRVYLDIFDQAKANGIEVEYLDRYVCTKGTPPEGFLRNEGLILRMNRLGLQIVGKARCGQVKYHFSQVFNAPFGACKNYPLLFCLVEKMEKFYPRLFWLSNSQAVWRNTDKLFKDWIGKSVRGEESLALPINVNLQAYDLYAKGLYQIDNKNEQEGKQFLQQVVAWSSRSLEDVENEITPEAAESDSSPQYFEIDLDMTLRELPEDPKENDFKVESDKPDFSQVIKEYGLKTLLYGEMTAKVFLSKNCKIKYLFLEQRTSRHVFLAVAESVGDEITKQGLKKTYFTQALTLPLCEYKKQFPFQSFISTDPKFHKGSYVYTWNYLREVPVIIEYYNSRGLKLPPKI